MTAKTGAVLQGLIDATPAGGTVDLGADTYFTDHPIMIRKPLTVHGNRAVVQATPSAERNHSVFVVHGTHDVLLLGSWTVRGSRPYGVDFDPSREAQHGIEIAGCARVHIDGLTIQSVFGDNVYVTKDSLGNWSSDIALARLTMIETGRQGFSLVAVHGCTATQLTVRRRNRSVCDIEPPGHDWGCTDFTWTDSDVYGPQTGFVLAAHGQGKTGTVRNITLDGIRCHDHLMNVSMVRPDDARSSNLTIRNCESDVTAHGSPIVIQNVDGVRISGLHQQLGRGVDLVSRHQCTDVVQG